MLQMLEANRAMERLADANVKQDADMTMMATQLASIQQALTALSAKFESSNSSSNNGHSAGQPSDTNGRCCSRNKRKLVNRGKAFNPTQPSACGTQEIASLGKKKQHLQRQGKSGLKTIQ